MDRLSSASGKLANATTFKNYLTNEARVPVSNSFAPNITFSVLYTRNGQYSFQIALSSAVPQLDIRAKTDKTHYQPGELVNVELTSLLKGKPVSAQLTVGVVDEMIYALQPEIAPNIGKVSIRWA